MDEATDKIFAVFMILILAVFVAFLFIGLTSADAELLSDDIGINLSDVCLASLQYDSSPCPDYRMIQTIFVDTTLPELSGGFSVIDGLYQRDSEQINNHYEFYRTNGKSDQWIDPPADTMPRIKMIEIRPTLPEYKITGNSTLMMLDDDSDSFSRFLAHSRYVSPDCMSAAITSENWLFVLGDTLNYLQHDCDPKFTHMETISKYTKQKTVFDFTESRDYEHKQWIQKIKDNCLTEYQKCK